MREHVWGGRSMSSLRAKTWGRAPCPWEKQNLEELMGMVAGPSCTQADRHTACFSHHVR